MDHTNHTHVNNYVYSFCTSHTTHTHTHKHKPHPSHTHPTHTTPHTHTHHTTHTPHHTHTRTHTARTHAHTHTKFSHMHKNELVEIILRDHLVFVGCWYPLAKLICQLCWQRHLLPKESIVSFPSSVLIMHCSQFWPHYHRCPKLVSISLKSYLEAYKHGSLICVCCIHSTSRQAHLFIASQLHKDI